MLNLGLESLAATETSAVSNTEFILAGIECMQAEMDLNAAIYDAQTFATNMYNYNEVVTSLKKHSSTECIAFAQELLGSSMEEEQAAQMQAKKKSFGQKVLQTLRIWWKKFKRFLRMLRTKIAGWFKSKEPVSNDSSSKKPVSNDFSVTVPMSEKDLNELAKKVTAVAEGQVVSVKNEVKNAVTISGDAYENWMESALNALSTCEGAMDKADPEKASTPEAVKKALNVKAIIAPVTSKISKGCQLIMNALKKKGVKMGTETVPPNKKSDMEILADRFSENQDS